MKVEETTIVWDPKNKNIPMLIHRSGSVYVLHDPTNIDMPLRLIDREEVWELENVPESLRAIMRKYNS